MVNKALAVVHYAEAQLGKPYVWGGAGPDGYDCSGLVMASYWHAAGLQLPHYTGSQVHLGAHVARASVRPGDCAYVEWRGGVPQHVVMVVEGSHAIQAPHTGANVGYVNLDSIIAALGGKVEIRRFLKWTDHPTPPPVPTPQHDGHPQLVQGATGAAVKLLQQRLNVHGYRVAVDGVFGPVTEQAVRAFQRSHGLVTDGVVGPRTWAALG